MKYYSDVTKKIYETEEELNKAEQGHKLELAKKEEVAQQKKERANEVQDAYKKAIEVRKKAQKEIEEAEKKYYELRDKFVQDYGSWHMTYTNKDGVDKYDFSTLTDLTKQYNRIFKDFWNDFFGW